MLLNCDYRGLLSSWLKGNLRTAFLLLIVVFVGFVAIGGSKNDLVLIAASFLSVSVAVVLGWRRIKIFSTLIGPSGRGSSLDTLITVRFRHLYRFIRW